MPSEPDKNLKPILDKIILDGVGDLSIIHRCRLIQKICDDVYARKWHALMKPGGGICVNTEAEDEALVILVSSLSYSDRYKNFFHRNAATLGRELALTHPYGRLKNAFNTWSGADRMKFLRALGERQIALFNHDMLDFAQVPVSPATLNAGNTGEFSVSNALPMSDRGRKGQIKIAEDYMNTTSPARLCGTLWHENVHALSLQFASAVHDKRMTESNPFHADAAMMRERFEYYAMIGTTFPDAYHADPEEKLAYTTTDTFINSWKHHSAWYNRAFRFLTKTRQP